MTDLRSLFRSTTRQGEVDPVIAALVVG
ncbi:MAG: hypothetical protein RJA70_2109, partial [Pseudomonadota bacterium]